jgi:hypothetical protein
MAPSLLPSLAGRLFSPEDLIIHKIVSDPTKLQEDTLV